MRLRFPVGDTLPVRLAAGDRELDMLDDAVIQEVGDVVSLRLPVAHTEARPDTELDRVTFIDRDATGVTETEGEAERVAADDEETDGDDDCERDAWGLKETELLLVVQLETDSSTDTEGETVELLDIEAVVDIDGLGEEQGDAVMEYDDEDEPVNDAVADGEIDRSADVETLTVEVAEAFPDHEERDDGETEELPLTVVETVADAETETVSLGLADAQAEPDVDDECDFVSGAEADVDRLGDAHADGETVGVSVAETEGDRVPVWLTDEHDESVADTVVETLPEPQTLGEEVADTV